VDADAGILDHELRHLVAIVHGERDVTLVRELDGVRYEIDQDLPQPLLVGMDHDRQRPGNMEHKVDPLGRGMQAKHVHELIEELADANLEGTSVDEQGRQYYLDVHIAYRQACLNAIEYLTKFGYSRAQAYAILGTAPRAGPHLGCGRHPECVRDAVAADRHLRVRRDAERIRAGEARRGRRGHTAVAGQVIALLVYV